MSFDNLKTSVYHCLSAVKSFADYVLTWENVRCFTVNYFQSESYKVLYTIYYCSFHLDTFLVLSFSPTSTNTYYFINLNLKHYNLQTPCIVPQIHCTLPTASCSQCNSLNAFKIWYIALFCLNNMFECKPFS